jgi:hypothetical protein
MMVPRLIFVLQIEEMIVPGENCIMKHLAISNAHQILHSKGKAIPVTGRGGAWGCETSRLPHFLDTRLTGGRELSAFPVGRSLPPGRFLVLISVRGWVNTRAIVRLKGLDQLKNLVTSSGIETGDLPACSIVPQPTTLPRSTWDIICLLKFEILIS